MGIEPEPFGEDEGFASGGPETPADHDYEGGFAAALMLKDLTLATEAAEDAHAFVPMGTRAEELYRRFVDSGGGAKDFSALITLIGAGG